MLVPLAWSGNRCPKGILAGGRNASQKLRHPLQHGPGQTSGEIPGEGPKLPRDVAVVQGDATGGPSPIALQGPSRHGHPGRPTVIPEALHPAAHTTVQKVGQDLDPQWHQLHLVGFGRISHHHGDHPAMALQVSHQQPNQAGGRAQPGHRLSWTVGKHMVLLLPQSQHLWGHQEESPAGKTLPYLLANKRNRKVAVSLAAPLGLVVGLAHQGHPQGRGRGVTPAA